jgi:hypothetical protein
LSLRTNISAYAYMTTSKSSSSQLICIYGNHKIILIREDSQGLIQAVAHLLHDVSDGGAVATRVVFVAGYKCHRMMTDIAFRTGSRYTATKKQIKSLTDKS